MSSIRRRTDLRRVLGAALADRILVGELELVGVVTNRLSEMRIGPALVDAFAVSVCDQNRTAVLRAPAGVGRWLASDGVYSLVDANVPYGNDPVVVLSYAHLDDATIDTATRLWEPYPASGAGAYESLESALTAALALHSR